MIAGGISISLDIDKTFDSLPREQLVLAMKAAKLSSEEIALALYIHQEARLHVEISGQKADIPLQQGIRQGCGLSPFLWSLATARLYNVCVEKAATCREPTGEVTLYADDVWASWWIRTQDQFKASLRAMGILFQDLQRRLEKEEEERAEVAFERFRAEDVQIELDAVEKINEFCRESGDKY
ncbi:Herc2, partial [Symbiodinium microadriaticum]